MGGDSVLHTSHGWGGFSALPCLGPWPHRTRLYWPTDGCLHKFDAWFVLNLLLLEKHLCVCAYPYYHTYFACYTYLKLLTNLHWCKICVFTEIHFFFLKKRELIVKKWELKIWKKIIKWTFKKAVNMCCCFLDVIKQTSWHFMWYPLLYFEIGIRVQNLMAVWMCLCKSLWSGYLRCHPHTASLNHQSDVTHFPFVTH